MSPQTPPPVMTSTTHTVARRGLQLDKHIQNVRGVTGVPAHKNNHRVSLNRTALSRISPRALFDLISLQCTVLEVGDTFCPYRLLTCAPPTHAEKVIAFHDRTREGTWSTARNVTGSSRILLIRYVKKVLRLSTARQLSPTVASSLYLSRMVSPMCVCGCNARGPLFRWKVIPYKTSAVPRDSGI